MPSFELGFSVVFTISAGFAFIYLFVFEFARIVKSEYKQGKSLAASLESSYKKSLFPNIISGASLFVASLIILAFSFSELASVATALAIISALQLVTNLLFVPFLVKICISFDGFGRKVFMLKKRNNLSSLSKSDTKEEA